MRFLSRLRKICLFAPLRQANETPHWRIFDLGLYSLDFDYSNKPIFVIILVDEFQKNRELLETGIRMICIGFASGRV